MAPALWVLALAAALAMPLLRRPGPLAACAAAQGVATALAAATQGRVLVASALLALNTAALPLMATRLPDRAAASPPWWATAIALVVVALAAAIETVGLPLALLLIGLWLAVARPDPPARILGLLTMQNATAAVTSPEAGAGLQLLAAVPLPALWAWRRWCRAPTTGVRRGGTPNDAVTAGAATLAAHAWDRPGGVMSDVAMGAPTDEVAADGPWGVSTGVSTGVSARSSARSSTRASTRASTDTSGDLPRDMPPRMAPGVPAAASGHMPLDAPGNQPKGAMPGRTEPRLTVPRYAKSGGPTAQESVSRGPASGDADPTNALPTNSGPTNLGPTNALPTNTSPTNSGRTNTPPTNTSRTNTGPTNAGPTNPGPGDATAGDPPPEGTA